MNCDHYHMISNLQDMIKLYESYPKQGYSNLYIINPPYSVYYLKVDYIYQLFSMIEKKYGDSNIVYLYDCHHDISSCLAAMYMGMKQILFTGNSNVRRKLLDIANKNNVKLYF